MPDMPTTPTKPTAPPPGGAAAAGPAEQKLRFLAKGTGMVPHYESQAVGIRRFHGWKHHAAIGPRFEKLDDIGRGTGEHTHHGGFVKQLGQVIAVGVRSAFAAEYLRHLRDGDLWPADEFTAQKAGVKYDPTFGAEHDYKAQAALADALASAQAMTSDATAGAAVEEAQTAQAKG